MKTTLLALFICLFGINGLKAQDANSSTSASNVRQDSAFKNEKEKKVRFNGHVAGIYGGFITFGKSDYSAYKNKDFMKLKLQTSYTVALNIIEINIGLQKQKNTVGIVAGIGAEFQNMEFDNKIAIHKNKKGIIEPFTYDEGSISSSRLRVLSANIPLMLEFQSPSNKTSRFHFNMGVVGSYNFITQTKVKITENKFPHKSKTISNRGNLNMPRFNFDLMAQMGGNHFAVWARYGITPLFEKNKGPELHQVSFGAAILF
ncbi:hypothetical protein AALK14_22665 [Butyricimonas hominis]|uniref:hypothetical protein n=1 Tax=Butyricimonas TaxID=574697 RepID=UPI0035192500